MNEKLLTYSPWKIETRKINSENQDFFESIFFQGNGKIGMRGFLPGDRTEKTSHGIFKAGVYEELKEGITDLVNLPDPLVIEIGIGDELYRTQEAINLVQVLDMEKGILTRSWSWNDVDFSAERILSFKKKNCLAINIKIKANQNINNFSITRLIDGNVFNLPINDDQAVKNQEVQKLIENDKVNYDDKALSLESHTIKNSFFINNSGSSSSLESIKGEVLASKNTVERRFSLNLEKGKEYTFSFFNIVETSKEKIDYNQVLSKVKILASEGFDRFKKESQEALKDLWKTSDIKIDGPIKDQCALRYSIFQLLQNCDSNNDNVSIGARGLTHSRYKGCYFWDTEVFMLPFYCFTQSEAASNLLNFRLNKLKAAEENAKKLNLSGARYPWMCSIDGSEQCETWDTGKCEVHITSDIAWAMDYFNQVSSLLNQDKVNEFYYQTAKYWASRFTFIEESNSYEMLFVKGPDEYSGVTKNNTFTTKMALNNIRLALENCKIDEEERTLFNQIIQKAKIPRFEDKGIFKEDDLFELLEPIDLEKIKISNEPLYKTICFDRLQRYKVIKQPDVVLLSLLMPELFSEKEKRETWNYYEPLTANDSTLGWAIHAEAAFQLGLQDKANSYLEKALFIDLENKMGNTGFEGLHIGACGGAWRAVILGCAGLKIKNGKPTFYSHLPKGWKSMEFIIKVKEEEFKIKLESKN
ncbi:MAG: hypothetical protein WC162_08335 [Sphaerochaetaceae bacterium]